MERIGFNQLPKGMVEKLMAVENYIKETSLDLQLLELMRLRVAQINSCAYCIDMHYKELKHTGETELRMSTLGVWKETSFFTPKEKAVLQFAEKLTTISQNDIADDVFEPLTSFFSTEEICHLTLAVAQINTWTRITATIKMEAGHYEVNQYA